MRTGPLVSLSGPGRGAQTKRAPFASVVIACLLVPAAVVGQAQSPPSREIGKDQVLVEVAFDGDYLELEERTAEWQAEVVRYEPPRLFLVVAESVLPALRRDGFLPRTVDPEAFFEELVRVDPASEQVLGRVRALGARLVQREESYAVFRVTLRQRRFLEDEGFRVRRIEEGELVARSVEIPLTDESSMALVVATGIDVFEVRDGILLGAAFDDQIEALRQQGLEVRVVPLAYDPPE